MFESANVTKFLKRYKDLCLDYQVLDNNKLTKLLCYCIQLIAKTIKLLKKQKSCNYTTLKKALCTEYQNNNTQQLLYLVLFFENYKNIAYTKKDDILDYCCKFDQIAQHCIEKKVLTIYTAKVQFIHSLPFLTISKLIQKLEINTKDLDTINYTKVLKHVIKQTAFNKAIQQINSTQNLSQQ